MKNKKNEQRFKIGDNVTYKNKKDCISDGGTKGFYYIGGVDQGGFVGEIRKYYSYNKKMDCWKILVTIKDKGYTYTMLESEFLEYDKPVVTNELFPIY